MITLYKFVPAWGMPDLSPFCIKVETYLRMVDVPFKTAVGDARKAPKGKLPYIEERGEIVADSRAIVAHVEARLSEPLDAGLSAEQQALSVAFRGLLEEEYYFYALCQRWQSDSGWRRCYPAFRAYGLALGLPRWLVPLILRSVRRNVIGNARGQGAGRHVPAEWDARMTEILDAVSTQLGDGPFFLGDRPRIIDATVYAFLLMLLEGPSTAAAAEYGRSLENLCDYCNRIKASYFDRSSADSLFESSSNASADPASA